MTDELARRIEADIRAHQLPLAQDSDWRDEVIWPNYDGLSIANVPGAVARALGVGLPGAAPPLDARLLDPAARFERVVLVLLDGFGYNLFQELRAERAFAQDVADVVGDGVLAPLTSVFPSTTVAALTTLWSGYPPAGHGLIGTRLFLREYAAMISSLSLAPLLSKNFQELMDWGFEPDKFLGVPGIAEALARGGAQTHLVIQSHLAGSGLSHMLHRGVGHVHGMKSFTDLWALLEEVMEATQRERCFIAIYWGALDAVSHDTGARSRRTLAEARMQLSRLRDFVAQWAGDGRTLFLALADHGHVDYEDAAKIRTADYPVLTDAMRMPPAGEAGAAYFFLRADLRAEAEQCFQEALRDRVIAMPAREALAVGLLGGAPHHPETAARAGELIAVCRAGARFSDPLDRYDFRSGHGALSAAEMLVPIILRAL